MSHPEEHDGVKLAGNNAGQGSGGGVLNLGALTLTNAWLVDNQAGNTGGGIYNGVSGTVRATHATVTGNQAVVTGGGIYNFAAPSAVTLDSTSKVVHNNPNNCAGPGTPIANCFG